MAEETSPTPKLKKDSSLHLWSRLLREVQANAESVHNECGLFSRRWNLLLLGKHFAGKSALISALKNEQLCRGKETSAYFEYNYIDLRDSESDNPMQISTWSLDTDSGLEKLLRYALNPRTIWNTLVLICVSFGEPWKMESIIEEILEILGQHIRQMDGMDLEEMQDLQDSLERHFREYIDPTIENTVSSTSGLPITHRLSVTRRFSGIMRPEIGELNEDNEQDEEVEPDRPPQWNCLHPGNFRDPNCELPPLGDGAFVKKLRVPIIFVVTKTDLTEHMEKVLGFTGDTFDAIELKLRQIAYKVGACLIYTSARNGTNINLLRKYLCHRLLAEEFPISAQTAEIDSIFIPAGWESQGKLDTLAKSIPEGLRIFPSKPSRSQRISLCNSARGFESPHSPHRSTDSQKEEKLIEAEEEQSFFSRMLNKLRASKSGEKAEGQDDKNTQADSASRKHTQQILGDVDVTETKTANLTRSTRESKGPGEAAVLSTFFNTLLTKPGGRGRSNAYGRQSEYSIEVDNPTLKNVRWRTRFMSSDAGAKIPGVINVNDVKEPSPLPTLPTILSFQAEKVSSTNVLEKVPTLATDMKSEASIEIPTESEYGSKDSEKGDNKPECLYNQDKVGHDQGIPEIEEENKEDNVTIMDVSGEIPEPNIEIATEIFTGKEDDSKQSIEDAENEGDNQGIHEIAEEIKIFCL